MPLDDRRWGEPEPTHHLGGTVFSDPPATHADYSSRSGSAVYKSRGFDGSEIYFTSGADYQTTV